MKTIVNEGSIRLKIPKAEKISKEMGVFYNPVMSLNRDISILLLNSVNKNNMQIADVLAATGVRSIRFLKELRKNKIKKIYINDYDKDAIKLIKQNLTLNEIKYKNNNKIFLSNDDANLFLLNSTGFDYIDIDPFGTPNPFLDAACKRIARNGILAVTATDTSALCGTFPKACIRKYWAIPKRDATMHETGLRILIRKIQLVAAQYGKALIPTFSYSKEHYMRVFLRNDKGKDKVDEILKQHGLFNNAGPMWLGKLWDKDLCNKILNNALKNDIFNTRENQSNASELANSLTTDGFSAPRNFEKISRENKELITLLKIIKEESKINSVGFYDLHNIYEINKIKHLQKKETIINKIKKFGYKASDTHFKGEGIRSDIPYSKLVHALKKE